MCLCICIHIYIYIYTYTYVHPKRPKQETDEFDMCVYGKGNYVKLDLYTPKEAYKSDFYQSKRDPQKRPTENLNVCVK